MVDLLQSISIMLLAITAVFSGLAIRNLIKTINGLNALMALVLVMGMRR
jgi:hypothetical protein